MRISIGLSLYLIFIIAIWDLPLRNYLIAVFAIGGIIVETLKQVIHEKESKEYH